MGENSLIYLSSFIFFIILMVGVGVWASKKVDTGEDFLMGGRNLGVVLLVGTIAATAIGTGSSMGAVQTAFEDGIPGAFFGIGLGIGIIILVPLFSNTRDKNFMTVSEEISYYYGASKEIKAFTSIMLFFAEVGWLGTHILGGSIYLSWITGIDPFTSKIITALGFALYTIIGGYLAVVYTDLIQSIILFIGFLILGIVSFVVIGGFQGINEKLPESMTSLRNLANVGFIPSVSLVLVTIVAVLVIPAYRHRIYSAKNISVVKRSFLFSGVFAILFTIIPTVVGMGAKILNPEMVDSSYAFPFMITELFPLWIGAFILVAGLAATLSSGDSDSIAATTILMRDIYQVFAGKMPPKEKTVLYSRIGLVFVIGVSLLFILTSNNIIEYIENMSSTVMSGTLVAILMGKFWKRATWQGGVTSIVTGSIVSFVVLFNETILEFWGNPVIPSLIISLIFGVIVSLMTPKRRLSDNEALRVLEKERKSFVE